MKATKLLIWILAFLFTATAVLAAFPFSDDIQMEQNHILNSTNVSAMRFIGDGSLLTGITASANYDWNYTVGSDIGSITDGESFNISAGDNILITFLTNGILINSTASGGSSTSYDQDLNTTSNVTFNDITATGTIVGSIHYSNITSEPWIEAADEGNLNVNSSDNWDGLDSPGDINAGDIADDGTYATTGRVDTINTTVQDLVTENVSANARIDSLNSSKIDASEEGNLNVNNSNTATQATWANNVNSSDVQNTPSACPSPGGIDSFMTEYAGSSTTCVTPDTFGVVTVLGYFTVQNNSFFNGTVNASGVVYSEGAQVALDSRVTTVNDSLQVQISRVDDVNSTAESKADPGDCGVGEYVQNTTTGGVECSTPPDTDTTYTNGTGLNLTSEVFSLLIGYRLPQSCGNGEIPEYNSGTGVWDCGIDNAGGGAGSLNVSNISVIVEEVGLLNILAGGNISSVDVVSGGSGIANLTINGLFEADTDTDTHGTLNVSNSTDDVFIDVDTGKLFFVSNNGNLSIAATKVGNDIYFNLTALDRFEEDTDTQLSQTQVEDFAGGMFSGNTETLITVTYQGGDNTVDLEVDNDLANYDNTNSDFFDTAGLPLNSTNNILDWNNSYTIGNPTTGNAGTATALAADGSDCSAGSAPIGVDENGDVEGCTDYEEDISNEAGLYAALSDVSEFIETGDAATVATINTGQGATEVYAMDQDVQTSDDVVFANINVTTNITYGSGTAVNWNGTCINTYVEGNLVESLCV